VALGSTSLDSVPSLASRLHKKQFRHRIHTIPLPYRAARHPCFRRSCCYRRRRLFQDERLCLVIRGFAYLDRRMTSPTRACGILEYLLSIVTTGLKRLGGHQEFCWLLSMSFRIKYHNILGSKTRTALFLSRQHLWAGSAAHATQQQKPRLVGLFCAVAAAADVTTSPIFSHG
jgi:hypothetical protein